MKKVLSILLAVIFLTGNVGISFATHYCGGKVFKRSIVFDGSELTCGMEKKTKSPCSEHDETVRKNCCKNEVHTFKIEEDFNSPKVVKSTVDYNFVAAFVVSYINLYSFDTSAEVEYLNYSPPLLNLDIPVLVQSFLL